MQMYGSLDLELLSAFPMASESSLPDTLCEFIHEYGAMEGVKSDNAKSETSFTMKDIFACISSRTNSWSPLPASESN